MERDKETSDDHANHYENLSLEAARIEAKKYLEALRKKYQKKCKEIAD